MATPRRLGAFGAGSVLVAATACGLFLGGRRDGSDPPPLPATVALVDPMVKVLRRAPLPETPPGISDLDTPAGTIAPLQVDVHAGGRPLADLTAQATVAPPLTVRVYREGYVRVDTASNVEGAAGDWPDPLIPAVDLWGEPRAAFPVDVAAGENQPLWIEVEVPADAAAGRYPGAITVNGSGLTPVTLPFAVRVRGFALPATSALPTIFGFSAISAMHAHDGRYVSDQEGVRLYHLYAALALRYRVTLGGGIEAPPDYRIDRSGAVAIDWTRYDDEVGPLLDGTLPGAPGARGTTVELRLPAPGRLPPAALAAYLAAWRDHFRARGWLDRLYDYTWDEPQDGELDAVRARAALVATALPDVPRLVTASPTPALDAACDLFTPLVNCVDPKPGGDFGPPGCGPDAIARLHRRGERVFFYQSCMSHGCDVVGDGYFTGWTRYVVDAPPLAARVMGWLAFRLGLDGELYYNTVEAFNEGDPWRSTYRHGGNGDGTLFYPGTPAHVGGRGDIPVASLRLAYIGLGLQDYALLALARQRGGRAAAIASDAAAHVAPHAWQWPDRPAALRAARSAVMDAIEGRPAAE